MAKKFFLFHSAQLPAEARQASGELFSISPKGLLVFQIPQFWEGHHWTAALWLGMLRLPGSGAQNCHKIRAPTSAKVSSSESHRWTDLYPVSSTTLLPRDFLGLRGACFQVEGSRL